MQKSPELIKQEKKNTDDNILYSIPAKPLDFSFKGITTLNKLSDIEPNSGIRKSIDKISKQKKIDSKSGFIDFEDDDVLSLDFIEKFLKMNDRKKLQENTIKNNKKTVHKNKKELIELKPEDNIEILKKIKVDIINSNSKKNQKIKYISFTNSILLHSNEIKSLERCNFYLEEILLDLDIIAFPNVNKIDLIQWLDISNNKLEEIHSDLKNLRFLKIFYCHRNLIREIGNIMNLKFCKNMINLTLHGNPIDQIKGYRQFIIEMVPTLEKFDQTLVSEKELDIIHYRGSRWGEKRNIFGEIIEYPKLRSEIIHITEKRVRK